MLPYIKQKPALRRRPNKSEPWVQTGFRLPESRNMDFEKLLIDRRQSVQQFIEEAINEMFAEKGLPPLKTVEEIPE